MPRVVHFEIHAEDPERAARFYTSVFGWDIQKWEGPADYWMVKTGPPEEPGIDGGIHPRQGTIDGTAVIAYVCTIEVDNVDAYHDKAITAGAAIAVPKMPIPNVGWLVYLKDTEGNLFGLFQPDQAAA